VGTGHEAAGRGSVVGRERPVVDCLTQRVDAWLYGSTHRFVVIG
jgi:hypothetical protein